MQQLSLFPEIESQWCSDDWQTPNEIASLMAKLVKRGDRRILEPSAGKGQIVKYIREQEDREVFCIESNRDRYIYGCSLFRPHHYWSQADFLHDPVPGNFDLIIGNPPFSLCVEFIRRSLLLLNPENSEARILFLLPIDWNCSVERGTAWKKLDAYIHHEYQIMGRVAYLDASGIPQTKRQIYDAVFDIRPGIGNAVTYLGD
ncbi:MAG: hypothetical protein V7L23_30180 [Nostoc sp.]|uniref:hypothetical protein n=1 Tax=Nostoc sp. TaxID=1180 RepID=UPI002FF2E784